MLQFSRLTQLQTKYKFKYKNDEIYFKLNIHSIHITVNKNDLN